MSASLLSGIPTLGDLAVARIEVWLLVLVRVSAIVFLLPVLNSEEVPATVKAGLSFFLSLILFPLLPDLAVEVPKTPAGLFLLALRELYVGLVIGFAGTFLFAALALAGSFLDQETGFNSVQLFDPTTLTEESALAHFLRLLFGLLFLAVGGHLLFIKTLADTFQHIPLAGAHLQSPALVTAFTRMTADSLLLGCKLAAPVGVTLFLSTIALAVVARIMPSLNVWLVGMPMKIGLGLMSLAFALPLMWSVFWKEQPVFMNQLGVIARVLGAGP